MIWIGLYTLDPSSTNFCIQFCFFSTFGRKNHPLFNNFLFYFWYISLNHNYFGIYKVLVSKNHQAKHAILYKSKMDQSFESNCLKSKESSVTNKTTNNGIKPKKCSQCNYASSQTGNLKTHFKTHSGEKFNKFNQCDYATSYPGTLKRHVKIHSGEKLKKCNQCDYASSRAGNLKEHFKTHSGEKLNKCNRCDYASYYPGTLKRHVKIHSGEKLNNATSVTTPPLMLAP